MKSNATCWVGRGAAERSIRGGKSGVGHQLVQFARFDLGQSFMHHQDVWTLIKSKLPVSISLGVWSFLAAYLLSIPLGVAKALRRDGWFDRGSTQVLFILYSIPGFVLAVAGLNLLCHQLHWFPSKGFDWGHPFHSSVLPLACEMVGAFTALTLFTRNGLLDNLTAD